MDRAAMEGISERLASVDGLYFPRAFLQGAAGGGLDDTPRRKSALLDLLARDAPIFLERYGPELTVEELCAFDGLSGDYEVRWYLTRLRAARDATAEGARARTVAVRNRRRAYMEQLVREGDYFSEDAMREREPYLHHEYVGKFQDPVGRGMPRPGERWSETLMRRAEEAVLVEKIRGEQMRRGVCREEWVGEPAAREEDEEEEEEEEEEETDTDEEEEEEEMKEKRQTNGQEDKDAPHHAKGQAKLDDKLSAEELQEQLEQFTKMMQQKFLDGEDSSYLDYSKIDYNERLDDHWVKEASQDAEEKYFDDD